MLNILKQDTSLSQVVGVFDFVLMFNGPCVSSVRTYAILVIFFLTAFHVSDLPFAFSFPVHAFPVPPPPGILEIKIQLRSFKSSERERRWARPFTWKSVSTENVSQTISNGVIGSQKVKSDFNSIGTGILEVCE